MLKIKDQETSQRMVEGDATLHCKPGRGWRKAIKVSSSCKFMLQITREIAQDNSRAILTIV